MTEPKVSELDVLDKLFSTLPDPHLQEISLSPKGTIAHHLRTWHGTRRQETPWKLLVQWSKDELTNAHEAFHTGGQ